MKCLKCGSENSSGAKFCAACGSDMEEQRRISLLEQEQLAQEKKKQEELRVEARRKRFYLWRSRFWGNKKRKIWTITSVSALFLVIVLVARGIFVQREVEQREIANTFLSYKARTNPGVIIKKEAVNIPRQSRGL